MKFSPQQDNALRSVKRWLEDPSSPQVFHLFGYAGTGKTTLAKHLAEGVDGDVQFGAFTGKAASVLRSKGCHNATTIHSMIYHSRDKSTSYLRELEEELEKLEKQLQDKGERIDEHPMVTRLRRDIADEQKNASQPLFVLNPLAPVKDASLIVIDECSMVNAQMGEDLLSFGVKVLVLGDPAQLPPVGGAGYFTENVRPNVMLTEIHRQAEDSAIIRLATQVRLGSPIPVGEWGPGTVVHPEGTKLSTEEMLSYDQVLVGRNATRRAANSKFRKLHGFHDKYPEEGDRLVCLRNNHDIGLLNGSIFYVTDVEGVMDCKVHMSVRPEDDHSSLEVAAHEQPFFGESIPFYERSEAQEFDFGYALTCHKAQGSQWKSVCIFDESFCFRKDSQRWLYTAITRAAEKVTVVRMRR